MNQDYQLALMYGELAARYIRRGEADNAALLAARAMHFAGLYSLTAEWRRARGVTGCCFAIWRDW
jgi:hypothetical protein